MNHIVDGVRLRANSIIIIPFMPSSSSTTSSFCRHRRRRRLHHSFILHLSQSKALNKRQHIIIVYPFRFGYLLLCVDARIQLHVFIYLPCTEMLRWSSCSTICIPQNMFYHVHCINQFHIYYYYFRAIFFLELFLFKVARNHIFSGSALALLSYLIQRVWLLFSALTRSWLFAVESTHNGHRMRGWYHWWTIVESDKR